MARIFLEAFMLSSATCYLLATDNDATTALRKICIFLNLNYFISYYTYTYVF